MNVFEKNKKTEDVTTNLEVKKTFGIKPDDTINIAGLEGVRSVAIDLKNEKETPETSLDFPGDTPFVH